LIGSHPAKPNLIANHKDGLHKLQPIGKSADAKQRQTFAITPPIRRLIHRRFARYLCPSRGEMRHSVPRVNDHIHFHFAPPSISPAALAMALLAVRIALALIPDR
jgi:hypothetical protein